MNASSEACWRVCEAIVSSDIDEPQNRAASLCSLWRVAVYHARMWPGTDRLQPLLVSCVQRAEKLLS